MTTEEIEVIINSDIPSYQKSKLIEQLFANKKEEVKICKEGGEVKPSFEEWIKNVSPDFQSDNYDLRAAYEKYPFEELETWRKDPKNNHLGSVVKLDNGDYMFLKLGKEDQNPELKFELDTYTSGENGLKETHDLIFDEGTNRYYYRKKVESKKEGGSTPEPDEEITIGDKKYSVSIADTEKERRIGLSKCTDLPKDQGMLFVFDEPVNQYFTMAETDIDLDIIFIDEEGVVISVNSVKARTGDPVVCEHKYKYVLEVNINSGIEVGDELDQEDLDFTDEEKEQVKRSKMLVLNSEGDVQYRLEGGERICSMIFTRKLIKTALKAYKSDSDMYYRKVGKMIFKELDAQDSRPTQYTEKPE